MKKTKSCLLNLDWIADDLELENEQKLSMISQKKASKLELRNVAQTKRLRREKK